MPWKETCAVEQRLQFVNAVKEQPWNFAECCRRFGVSRTTGYIWMERYRKAGEAGLQARSRAPHSHPNAMDPGLAQRLLEVKMRYPCLGPQKVLECLQLEGYPEELLPAKSTVGELFKRNGLVQPRQRRVRSAPHSAPLAHADQANALWSLDFKGQFRTADGRWCYPLTVSDNASRYLLVCQGLARPTEQAVWAYMEQAFRQYGLPRAIRSDNGAPFASVGLGGLTRLAVWWIKLGIGLERIVPGHPEQNARHERMHRTLRETIAAPRANLAAQQRRLHWFQDYYNHARPHAALGGVPPARCYSTSPRTYPCRLREPHYPVGFKVQRVRTNGQIRWRSGYVFIAEALIGEPVALRQLSDELWELWFYTHKLGLLNSRTMRVERSRS